MGCPYLGLILRRESTVQPIHALDSMQQILAERHSLGTKKVTDWSLTTFKISVVVVVVFKFVQPGE